MLKYLLWESGLHWEWEGCLHQRTRPLEVPLLEWRESTKSAEENDLGEVYGITLKMECIVYKIFILIWKWRSRFLTFARSSSDKRSSSNDTLKDSASVLKAAHNAPILLSQDVIWYIFSANLRFHCRPAAVIRYIDFLLQCRLGKVLQHSPTGHDVGYLAPLLVGMITVATSSGSSRAAVRLAACKKKRDSTEYLKSILTSHIYHSSTPRLASACWMHLHGYVQGQVCNVGSRKTTKHPFVLRQGLYKLWNP